MDLPKILLTGLFFLFFLVFPEFLDIWKAENGKKGKKQNVQKPNAPSVGFCFFFHFQVQNSYDPKSRHGFFVPDISFFAWDVRRYHRPGEIRHG